MKKASVVFLMKRIFAQMIDLLVGFLSLFVSLAVIVPKLEGVIKSPVIRAIIALILVVLINLLVQYPFMLNGQTLGKGFYRLRIVSTDKKRKNLTVPIIIQREILCKLMSCYFICLPVFSGKLGGHEEATHTKLICENKPVRVKGHSQKA
ncbi:RDD family protein [Lapidilactobacillus luobeiensis]|uniref:RDD family protein n=1 Tax=Lapidilactobacillus luobeiensis TaxID=2950371 RepID=UPI0021C305F9|nr:RDD family protein [Lapidilactobacillus luobeiensis]